MSAYNCGQISRCGFRQSLNLALQLPKVRLKLNYDVIKVCLENKIEARDHHRGISTHCYTSTQHCPPLLSHPRPQRPCSIASTIPKGIHQVPLHSQVRRKIDDLKAMPQGQRTKMLCPLAWVESPGLTRVMPLASVLLGMRGGIAWISMIPQCSLVSVYVALIVHDDAHLFVVVGIYPGLSWLSSCWGCI